MSGNVIAGLTMLGLVAVSALIVITRDPNESRTSCIAGYQVYKHSGLQVISENGGGVPCSGVK